MNTPPGLLCAACHAPLYPHLARRTDSGYVHVNACATSPAVLHGGEWVRVGHVMRWLDVAV